MAKRKASPQRSGTQGRSFMEDSPWLKVMEEMHQGWSLRKGLIQKIENRVKGKVIVYFTSFYDEDAMIIDKDAEMVENMLSVEHEFGKKIVLILNSAGGIGEAAERIVNVCRAYSGGQFEVIVPHMAKSAATLICFGASIIHMSSTGELGPVDPQIKYIDDSGQEQWIAAEEYIRSYEQLMDRAVSGKTDRVEALMQQLVRYDARHIERLKSAQALSGSISIKLLKSGMMSRFTDKTIREKVAPFLTQEETKSHGRMITISEAKACGLKVREINLGSDLWNWLWELYIRVDCTVSRRKKILESSISALGSG